VADEASCLPITRPPSHGLDLLNFPFSVSEPFPRIIQHSDEKASGKASPSPRHVFLEGYRDAVDFTFNLGTKWR
jgi:hypothetical protein